MAQEPYMENIATDAFSNIQPFRHLYVINTIFVFTVIVFVIVIKKSKKKPKTTEGEEGDAMM